MSRWFGDARENIVPLNTINIFFTNASKTKQGAEKLPSASSPKISGPAIGKLNSIITAQSLMLN